MKLLADSDFLFGLFVLTDPHYERAREVWRDVVEKGIEVTVLNLVVQETATVLSYKINQSTAVNFVTKFPLLETRVLVIDGEIEKMSWEIFLRQKKKGTSFGDCANLAVIQKYKLDGILTFDEFYPEEIVVK